MQARLVDALIVLFPSAADSSSKSDRNEKPLRLRRSGSPIAHRPRGGSMADLWTAERPPEGQDLGGRSVPSSMSSYRLTLTSRR